MTLAVAVVGLGFGANHARVLSETGGRAPGGALRQRRDAARRRAAVDDPQPTRTSSACWLRDGSTRWSSRCRRRCTRPRRARRDRGGLRRAGREAAGATAGRRRARMAEAAAAAGVAADGGPHRALQPGGAGARRAVSAQGEVGRVLQLAARRLADFRAPARDVNVVHDSALHDIDVMRWRPRRRGRERLRGDAVRRAHAVRRRAYGPGALRKTAGQSRLWR